MAIEIINDTTNDTIDPVRMQWKPDGDLWIAQGIRDVILMSREMAYELYVQLEDEFDHGQAKVPLKEVVNG